MLAKELVQRIVDIGGGYMTRAQILSRVNTEQNRVCSMTSLVRRVYALQTTAGSLTYTLPTIDGMQTESMKGAYFTRPRVDSTPVAVMAYDTIAGRVYLFGAAGVTFRSSDKNAPTSVLTFANDPAGDIVYLDLYCYPPQILVETDTVFLPDSQVEKIELEVLTYLYKRGYGSADNLERSRKRVDRSWSVFLSNQGPKFVIPGTWGFPGVPYPRMG